MDSVVSYAVVWNILTISSDHYALFLDYCDQSGGFRKRFRFENAWVQEADCRIKVEEGWRAGDHASLQDQIQRCGEGLQQWGNELRARFKKKMAYCRDRIAALKGSNATADVEAIKNCKHELGMLLEQQEIYWKQRSKQFWLKAGDANTKYFHNFASSRRKKNSFFAFKRRL